MIKQEYFYKGEHVTSPFNAILNTNLIFADGTKFTGTICEGKLDIMHGEFVLPSGLTVRG